VAAAWLDPPPPPVSGAARASDGDSFVLGDDRIRLLGLDAPELRQQCQDETGVDWACGASARDHMAGLLGGGEVRCTPEDKDQYDRLLARCTVGGADLGASMVSAGLAISAGDYGREEQAARQARRGIWRGGFERPADWREDNPRGGGFGFMRLPWF
jgi:endonuclease YncB( thermonuclease family)